MSHFSLKTHFALVLILISTLLSLPSDLRAKTSQPKTNQNSYSNFLEASLLSKEQKSEESLKALQKALAQDPHSHYLKLKLAQAYIVQKDFETAKKLLKEIINENPQEDEAQLLLGKLAHLEGDDKTAIKRFIHCQNANPEQEECVILLARQEAQDNNLKTAQKILKKYLEKKPDSLEARFLLASLYEDKELVKKELEELLNYHPGHIPSHLALGRYYEWAEKPEKA
ncbi:MAG: tetratricopeptide repeat protein, partial [Deltaproteobacteria bacterium]|nr:tetratricopeptide repeat protein [Deltaproteobacteria bacterium]